MSIEEDIELVRTQFDADYYVGEYPDLRSWRDDLCRHFCTVGWFEGRNPNPYFDVVGYLLRNPDVAQAGVNPLAHYLRRLKFEPRVAEPSAAPSARTLVAFGFPVTDWVQRLRLFVDVDFYLEQFSATPPSGFNAVAHFAYRGWREGYLPQAGFDLEDALRRYDYAARLMVNPVIAALVTAEGHSLPPPGDTHPDPTRDAGEMPAPGFDAAAKAAATTGGAADFAPQAGDEVDVTLIRPLFDSRFYLEANPNLGLTEENAVYHYYRVGWKEGRDPSPLFSTQWYLQNYEDVRKAGVNPLRHYAGTGFQEGRASRVVTSGSSAPPAAPEPVAEAQDAAAAASDADADKIALIRHEFSVAHYLAQRKDVADSGVDPVVHYYHTGWREGTNPTRDFDTAYYLEANPDVREAGVNPFWHYLAAGRAESRLCKRSGGYRRDILESIQEPRQRADKFIIPAEKPISQRLFNRRLATRLKGAPAGLVVAVSHDCYLRSIGGIQIFIADEEKRFRERNYAYLHVSPLAARLSLLDTDASRLPVWVAVSGTLIGVVEFPHLLEALEEVAGRIRTRHLIVHNMFGYSERHLISLHDALAPTRRFFWLHDYSSLCEGYNLLRNDLEFCHAPDRASMACRICVYGSGRRQHVECVRRIFGHCDFDVVAPSMHTLKTWLGRSDLPHRRIIAHPHWMLADPVRRKRPRHALDGPLRVAFIGYPSAPKGWPLYAALANELEKDQRYRFYHFAAASTATTESVTFVKAEVRPRQRMAMVELLMEHDIDFLAVPSSWPETFSYVTCEALAAGCSVLCLETSGNVTALVRSTGQGVAFAGDDDFLAFFRSGAAVDYALANRPNTWRIVNCGTSATLPDIEVETAAA